MGNKEDVMTKVITADINPNDSWRHDKGGIYTVIGFAKLQTNLPIDDMTSLVIYRAEDGTLWARPRTEFLDGRFKRLTEEKVNEIINQDS